MNKTILSSFLIAGFAFAADAAQAAGPTSVSEAPAVWYAERITILDSAPGASTPFPAAAYENGPTLERRVDVQRTRPGLASMTLPFPSSVNETGPVL
jgi:hypothetical protein